ncbi:MAG: hypothetical protein SWH54_15230 [Thermodesulfobacteriota bacterium]|nr:hypothetical protein [Thermodesulfobacteriota bacterium]
MNELKYIPGAYDKERVDAHTVADQYAGNWEQRLQNTPETFPAKISSTICLSPKIGVGALEIADILAEKIDYAVTDHEILIISQKMQKIESNGLSALQLVKTTDTQFLHLHSLAFSLIKKLLVF